MQVPKSRSFLNCWKKNKRTSIPALRDEEEDRIAFIEPARRAAYNSDRVVDVIPKMIELMETALALLCNPLQTSSRGSLERPV